MGWSGPQARMTERGGCLAMTARQAALPCCARLAQSLARRCQCGQWMARPMEMAENSAPEWMRGHV